MYTKLPSTILEKFLYLSSTETSQQFLFLAYEQQKIPDSKKKSYHNCTAFNSYIEQGITFLDQAGKSPLNIQPILLFYGLVFLIKACILTVDPSYPESSSVLAHGVSTRKRKKQNYLYLQDEVKIQKNGLFPHLSDKMFHMKHLEGIKLKIEALLKEIPELLSFFQKWNAEKYGIKIEKIGDHYCISEEVLDYFNMTKERLKHFLHTKSNIDLNFTEINSLLAFSLKDEKSGRKEILPFRFHILEQTYYLIKNSKDISFFPELSIHYLLLYHLSMLARYEAEWWTELIHHKPSIEYPLIVCYINITFQKIPFLISELIFRHHPLEEMDL